MTDLEQQPLLTPFRMGELLLPNRIVMAPLTRQRARILCAPLALFFEETERRDDASMAH
jgi:2,4-dienoyl-CoA reductase-like NADH-dependent reductase (Old Yellow Enzyme family)